MNNYAKVGITIPKGMKRSHFEKWLGQLQGQLQANNNEAAQIEELLEIAEFAKLNSKGSFNYHVKLQLEKQNLPEACKNIVMEFMRFDYLKVLHEIIQERKLRETITIDVDSAERAFKNKGYSIDGDFWKKKVWLNSEQYRLTIVGRGMEISSMKYVKAVAIFGKNDMMIEELPPVYSAYLLDLV